MPWERRLAEFEALAQPEDAAMTWLEVLTECSPAGALVVSSGSPSDRRAVRKLPAGLRHAGLVCTCTVCPII